jgi:endonuclease YncB( thermonuclease family)
MTRLSVIVRAAVLAVSLAAAIAVPAEAQAVIDGGTIVLEGRDVRLWGVDAPDLDEVCGGWAAGRLAAAALQKLIANRSIVCQARGVDHQGRIFGRCRAGGVDLSAAMVREGWAWALVDYSRDYVAQETQAKAENIGVHEHQCEPASQWRQAHHAHPEKPR